MILLISELIFAAQTDVLTPMTPPMDEDIEQIITSSVGVTFYKIFTHFHSMMANLNANSDEKGRLKSTFYFVQDVLIDMIPESLRETAHVCIDEYMSLMMKEKADPEDVGRLLMESLQLSRSEGRK